jgi:hypothetical protein
MEAKIEEVLKREGLVAQEILVPTASQPTSGARSRRSNFQHMQIR